MSQWFAVDPALRSHPKFRRLAVALGDQDDLLVLGRLCAFWATVRLHAPDGDLSSWSDEDIGGSIGRPDCGAAALRSAGFLEASGKVRGWKIWQRWLRDAERKRNERLEEGRSEPVRDSPGQSGKVRATRHDSTVQESTHLATADAAAVSAGVNGHDTSTDFTLLPPEPQAVDPEADWHSGFAQFYESYPRKVKRPTAERAWMTLRPKGGDQEARDKAFGAILDGLDPWVEYWASEQTPKEKIPYPATFLNGRQFEDTP